MIISTKLTLDRRRKLKDNTLPVIIRITKDRKSSIIKTGVYSYNDSFIEIEDGTAALTKSNPSARNITRANTTILKALEEVRAFLDDLMEREDVGMLSAFDLKRLYDNRNNSGSLNEFMLVREQDLRKEGRQGYADLWRFAESFLRRYLGEIEFKQFDLKSIHKLESEHLSNNPEGINGLSVYLRVIRTAYYRFAKENSIPLQRNPWDDYTIRSKRTRKRATSTEVIKLFRDFDAGSGFKYDAQQFYLLSFYLAGMNLIDMAKLKVNQIHDGKIFYRRTKVSEEISMILPPQAKEILDRYMDGKKASDFALPIFDPSRNSNDNMTLYRSRRELYNKYIDEIFKEIGVVSSRRITFYSARHSWATRANELDKPITAISKGLGHTNIKTTQTYLDEIGENVIYELNRDIIDLE